MIYASLFNVNFDNGLLTLNISVNRRKLTLYCAIVSTS